MQRVKSIFLGVIIMAALLFTLALLARGEDTQPEDLQKQVATLKAENEQLKLSLKAEIKLKNAYTQQWVNCAVSAINKDVLEKPDTKEPVKK